MKIHSLQGGAAGAGAAGAAGARIVGEVADENHEDMPTNESKERWQTRILKILNLRRSAYGDYFTSTAFLLELKLKLKLKHRAVN